MIGRIITIFMASCFGASFYVMSNGLGKDDTASTIIGIVVFCAVWWAFKGEQGKKP